MKYFKTIVGLIFSGMVGIELYHVIAKLPVNRVVVIGALILAILTSLELALRPWLNS